MWVYALRVPLSLLFSSAAGGRQVLSTLTADSAAQILVACIILVALVILLGVGVLVYRRRWLAAEVGASEAGWTFDDLRKLRDKGDLSEAEYQKLRSALIGAFQGSPPPAESSATLTTSESSGEMPADFDLKKSPPA